MTPVQNPADPVRAVLTPRDAAWPAQLRGVAGMPAALYVRGAPYALARRLVAVVGTREPSDRGRLAAHAVALRLCTQHPDVGIVSGLALGVDTLAHVGALDARAQLERCAALRPVTVAVVAHGLDTTYPRGNGELADEIVRCGGAVVSEHPGGVALTRQALMLRNRITSALSCGVVVVETSPDGGTMHCARFALAQGRPVVVVRPDDPRDLDVTGADKLLTMGAVRARSTADVVAALGLSRGAP